MDGAQQTLAFSQDDAAPFHEALGSPLRVLVACEYSGTVREAFAAMGHDAMSCDILPTDRPGNHYEGDVRDVLDAGWDLMICHPPCKYISVSGVHWNNRGRGWDALMRNLRSKLSVNRRIFNPQSHIKMNEQDPPWIGISDDEYQDEEVYRQEAREEKAAREGEANYERYLDENRS